MRRETNEVSSCATRPIEAMVWIIEIDSAKSVADLKMSCSSIGAKLQTNFVVLDSKKKEWPQEDHQRRLQKKSLHSFSSRTEEKSFLTGGQVAWMIYE